VLAAPCVYVAGRFFETLIGRGNEPLWRLLSKIAVLYTLEPVFTIIFVINMTIIWEQVMARLRSQIFRRILIQKVLSPDISCFTNGILIILHSDNIGCACMNDESTFADYLHGFVTLTAEQF